MKKISISILILTFLFASACARTSDPENPAGKVDMSKPVDYVVVSEEERDDALYILTGQSPEQTEDTEETMESEEIIEEETEPVEETEPIEEIEETEGQGN